MSGTRRAGWSVLVSLALALSSCGGEPSPDPYGVCKADPSSQCCDDSECGSKQFCDFDYGCGVTGDRGVVCGGGTGTRKCIDLCDTTCSTPGTSCQRHHYFQGGDWGREVKACLPTP